MSILDEITRSYQVAEKHLQITVRALESVETYANEMTTTLDGIGADILVKQATDAVEAAGDAHVAAQQALALLAPLKAAVFRMGGGGL